MSMPTTRAVEHGPKATPRWLWLWLVIAAILGLNGIYYAHNIEQSSFQNQTSSRSLETRSESSVLAPGESTQIQNVRGGTRLCFDSWDTVEPYFWYDNDPQGPLRLYEGSETVVVRFQIRNNSGDPLPIYFWHVPHNQNC